MRIAVLLSGEVRALNNALIMETINFFKSQNADIYLCAWDKPAARKYVELVKPVAHKLYSPWTIDYVESFSQYAPKDSIHHQILTGQYISKKKFVVCPYNMFCMFYLMNESFKLMEASGRHYDIIYKLRPDVRCERFDFTVQPHTLTVASRYENSGLGMCHYGDFETMKTVSTIWEKLPEFFSHPATQKWRMDPDGIILLTLLANNIKLNCHPTFFAKKFWPFRFDVLPVNDRGIEYFSHMPWVSETETYHKVVFDPGGDSSILDIKDMAVGIITNNADKYGPIALRAWRDLANYGLLHLPADDLRAYFKDKGWVDAGARLYHLRLDQILECKERGYV